MPTVRFLALEQTMGRKPNNFKAPEARVSEYFGSHVFNRNAMREHMTSEAFKAVVDAVENGSKISRGIADQVASGMKAWALNLGATPMGAIRSITLPFLYPAMLGAGVVAILMSFENFNTTLMLVGSDAPLTITMFDKLKLGSTPVLNSVSLLLMVASAILGLASLLLQKNQLLFFNENFQLIQKNFKTGFKYPYMFMQKFHNPVYA